MILGASSSAGRLALALAVIVTLLATTSCGASTQPSERAEVLGTWESQSKGHVAQIELHGDGTAEVKNLPRAAVVRTDSQSLDWDDRVSARGEWSFTEPDSQPYSQAFIRVTLKDIEGSDESIQLHPWSGGELLVYYGDVEVGEHLTFVLEEGAPTPSPETVGRQDLVGHWSSDNEGQLWLKEDGTFQLKDIPLGQVAVDPSEVSDEVRVDLHGQWLFREEPLPLGPLASVSLHFLDVDGREPKVFDIMFPTLQEIEGGFALQLSDGLPRWELQRGTSPEATQVPE